MNSAASRALFLALTCGVFAACDGDADADRDAEAGWAVPVPGGKAEVTFVKEEKRLHFRFEAATESVRFLYCGVSTPIDKCPEVSDCAYKEADVKAEIKKVDDAAVRREFEKMMLTSFHSSHTPEAFLKEFCPLLVRVRSEEKCAPKEPCVEILKKKRT